MLDELVTVVRQLAIGLEIIRIDQCASLYILSNKAMQGFSFTIGNNLSFNFLAAAFLCTDNSSFASRTSPLF